MKNIERTHWNQTIAVDNNPAAPSLGEPVKIGKNYFYGTALTEDGRCNRICDIAFIIIFSIIFFPITVPLFCALGGYSDLVLLIREVHYDQHFTLINNVAGKAFFSKAKEELVPIEIEPIFGDDKELPFNMIGEILSYRLDLHPLTACISKDSEKFVDDMKAAKLNSGQSSLDELFSDHTKALAFIKAYGNKINHLKLSVCNDDEITEIIKNCPNLQSLVFNNSQISEAGLSELVNLKNLKTLKLKNCDRLTDLSNLTQSPNLVNFTITGSPLVNKLPAFDSFLNLESLKIEDISPNNIPSLLPLKNLQSLSLELGDTNLFPSIEGLDKLKELSIKNFSGLLPSFEHLALTKLDLHKCTIPSIDHLDKLTSLKHLHLKHCRFLENLKGIEHCVALESLYLRGLPHINDLPSFKNITTLKKINFQFMQLKLPKIKQCSELEELEFTYCRNLGKFPKLKGFKRLNTFKYDRSFS